MLLPNDLEQSLLDLFLKRYRVTRYLDMKLIRLADLGYVKISSYLLLWTRYDYTDKGYNYLLHNSDKIDIDI